MKRIYTIVMATMLAGVSATANSPKNTGPVTIFTRPEPPLISAANLGETRLCDKKAMVPQLFPAPDMPTPATVDAIHMPVTQQMLNTCYLSSNPFNTGEIAQSLPPTQSLILNMPQVLQSRPDTSKTMPSVRFTAPTVDVSDLKHPTEQETNAQEETQAPTWASACSKLAEAIRDILELLNCCSVECVDDGEESID